MAANMNQVPLLPGKIEESNTVYRAEKDIIEVCEKDCYLTTDPFCAQLSASGLSITVIFWGNPCLFTPSTAVPLKRPIVRSPGKPFRRFWGRINNVGLSIPAP